ncbi:hypothetical protein LTR53_017470 [Teratosphaeriaceae sp. CCFEE 6253]|nr:hypothetical protein LTR53_017470 [Teratosphaeriaceae sp. CCFEE 6253]
MADSLKNIAIVGASGQVGGSTLKHLLDSPRGFKVTVVTRTESEATFPSHPALTVKKGSYTDTSFLEDAFSGQDAVVFAVHFFAQNAQEGMFEAAAKAGVRWIIPNEYAGDTLNDAMVDLSPAFQPKRTARKQIEDLSKTYEGLKWIGVATNPFLEPVYDVPTCKCSSAC